MHISAFALTGRPGGSVVPSDAAGVDSLSSNPTVMIYTYIYISLGKMKKGSTAETPLDSSGRGKKRLKSSRVIKILPRHEP